MLKSISNKYKSLAWFLILSTMIPSCLAANQSNESPYPQPVNVASPSVKVSVQQSYVVYNTFAEIVDRSDVIVLGQPTLRQGVVNTARDPNDPAKEDPELFGIGRVYEVKVEGYLKGDGPELIYVVQSEGLIPSKSQELTEENFEQARQLFKPLPLELGKRYIFFLHSPQFTYSEFSRANLFGGIGHPWRFEITSSECVQPEDEVTDLYRYFPAQPLEDFVKLISDPSSIVEMPYPAPAGPETCLPERPTPYP
jgi:hypothetical protein